MNNHGIDYKNEKLNELFNITWPNLGYAKQMTEHSKYWYDYDRNDLNRENPFTEPYPDAMFEEAERREREVNDNIKRAVEIDKEIEESIARSERILDRYNMLYNIEVSGLTWGTHITPEFQQAMTLECMLDALHYENLNHKFDVVSTADINSLIEGLYNQGRESLKKWEEFKDSADGVA